MIEELGNDDSLISQGDGSHRRSSRFFSMSKGFALIAVATIALFSVVNVDKDTFKLSLPSVNKQYFRRTLESSSPLGRNGATNTIQGSPENEEPIMSTPKSDQAQKITSSSQESWTVLESLLELAKNDPEKTHELRNDLPEVEPGTDQQPALTPKTDSSTYTGAHKSRRMKKGKFGKKGKGKNKGKAKGRSAGGDTIIIIINRPVTPGQPGTPAPAGTPKPATPAPATTAPAGKTPTPAPATPAPATPAPAGKTNAPVTPAPATPAPAGTTPAPATPAPAGTTPAPATPAPAGTTPAPATPAPAGTTPAPATPAPAGTTPAPATPAPITPAPATASPAGTAIVV